MGLEHSPQHINVFGFARQSVKHPVAIGANRNQLVCAIDGFFFQLLEPHLVMGFGISFAKVAISLLEIESTNLATVFIAFLTCAGEFRVANSLFYADVGHAPIAS